MDVTSVHALQTKNTSTWYTTSTCRLLERGGFQGSHDGGNPRGGLYMGRLPGAVEARMRCVCVCAHIKSMSRASKRLAR